MNRSIAIFVALAVLVAHSLAIRTDGAGNLAPPYDQAYAACRIARNLAYEGTWTWNSNLSGLDSYPSMLWVMICAAAERLYLPTNQFLRVVGLLGMTISFFLTSRFHSDRAASLITPMLLAINGAVAAAAVSGTETALLTMLVTASFLAFERRWDRIFVILLLLCGLTRGEGWVLALVFFYLRLRERGRLRRQGHSELPGIRIFLVPLIGGAVMAVVHWGMAGHLLSPWFAKLLAVDNADWGPGTSYLLDFFVTTASPALLVYCIYYFFRQRLSHTGARALFIFLVWSLLVIANGGGDTPFCETMVPALPIALISAQEGMIIALNSGRRAVRRLALISFLGAILISTLASLNPTTSWHRSWMRARGEPRYGFVDALGRAGLDEEARATSVLRSVALFMRDHLDPRSTVLTPWPGSIGYLSSLNVQDLQGRVTPPPGRRRRGLRAVRPRVDVTAILYQRPDYIVPHLEPARHPPTLEEIALGWSETLDENRGERVLESLTRALEAYEVISIPLEHSATGGSLWQRRITILRRCDLAFTPLLAASFEEGVLTVELEHRGHWQVADLSILGRDPEGEAYSLSPRGSFVPGEGVMARSSLLLSETGERRVRLLRCAIDRTGPEIRELEIVLRNPGSRGLGVSALVSERVVVSLD